MLQMFVGWEEKKKTFTMNFFGKKCEKKLVCHVVSVGGFKFLWIFFAHVTVRHGVSRFRNSRSSMSFETTWFNNSRVLA